MFGLFKKKEKANPGSITFDYSQLMVDMHSHVLPGIDDGAQTLDESIVLIQKMMELGIKKIIATPHIMVDTYPNSPESIAAALNILKTRLIELNLDIDVSAAAEHYFDETLDKRIDDDQLMTMGDNYVLFEFSFISKPLRAIELIKKMRAKGYNPILAHPERYPYIKMENLVEMREWGCLLQVNTNSLTGYYGKACQQAAERMIDAEMVDFISSDMHHPRHAEVFEKALRQPYLQKLLFEQQTLKNKLLL